MKTILLVSCNLIALSTALALRTDMSVPSKEQTQQHSVSFVPVAMPLVPSIIAQEAPKTTIVVGSRLLKPIIMDNL